MAGGSIELSGLTKKFHEIAVDHIDLSVASGEFFSLLGPSGCGKTTTLRLIAGFEQPTSGQILLDGLAIQIALDDPVVGPARAFDLCMQFIAEQLGFEWKDSQRARNGGHQAGQSNGARQKGR